MSQVPHADRERDIEERAEEIEPGSADRLEQSRRAIDEASGAAAEAQSADLTDVEFDPSDSGAAGAADEPIDDVRDADERDGEHAGTDVGQTADQERTAESKESSGAHDEAYVTQGEGLSGSGAADAGGQGQGDGQTGGRP